MSSLAYTHSKLQGSFVKTRIGRKLEISIYEKRRSTTMWGYGKKLTKLTAENPQMLKNADSIKISD